MISTDTEKDDDSFESLNCSAYKIYQSIYRQFEDGRFVRHVNLFVRDVFLSLKCHTHNLYM